MQKQYLCRALFIAKQQTNTKRMSSTNTQRHIVFLPAWYPHKYDSMFGLFVRKHAEAAALSHHISVLYLYALEDSTAPLSVEHTQPQQQLSEWHIYYPKSKNPFLYLWRFVYYFFWGMGQIKKTRSIDAVHVHVLSRMGILASLYRLWHATPYIITEHWSRYLPSVNTYRGFWRKLLTSWSVKRAHAVLPVSHNLAQAMQQQGLSHPNYKVVNNVVAQVFFETQQPKGSITRAIHVSTFEDKSKNISGMLRNIAQLRKQGHTFEVVMIGIGQDYEAMQRLAADLGLLNSVVYFRGELQENELAQEMAQSHFLIMYSNYENVPVVISEAMACGLPVLATDVGGIHEHVNSSRGLLCPPQNDETFCQALEQMLHTHMHYNSQSINKYALQQFSYPAVAQELSHIYSEACQKK